MAIQILDKDVLIDGVSTTQIASTLKSSGITEAKVGQILGYWYAGALGGTKPSPFDFATDVETTDPDCAVTYERSFEHVDWVDGEDRVQASATPEELGFNARFHAIEGEFDAVADQLRGLGRCARDIRADLVGVVRELESKITALQNELHELRQAKPTPQPGPDLGILGTVKVADKYAYIAKYGNEFQLVEFAGATIGASPKGGTGGFIGDFGGLVDDGRFVERHVFEPEHYRSRELRDIVGEVEDLLGTETLRDVITDGGTVADLRTVAGGVTLESGIPLAAVIASMPAETRFSSVAEATDAITAHVVSLVPEETVKEVRAEVFSDERLRDAGADEVAGAVVTVAGVDEATTAVLASSGVDTTIGGLSSVTTAELSGRLAGSGVAVSPTRLRDAVATSRLAGALSRVR